LETSDTIRKRRNSSRAVKAREHGDDEDRRDAAEQVPAIKHRKGKRAANDEKQIEMEEIK